MSLVFLSDLQQSEVVLYLMIFLGILLIFEGVRQVARGHANLERARNRRMRMIAKGADPDKITPILLLEQPDSTTTNGGLVAGLRKTLARANVPFGPGTLVAISMVLAVSIFGAALSSASTPSAVMLAVGLGIGLPYAIVSRMAESRVAKLTMQLPDALDIMARGLRVGHPLNVTLRRVARDMPDPIGSEFGFVEDRTRHGADLATAFREFADRIDSEDVHYLSVCVGIQNGTGGNLARVLSVLSQVVRGRLMMKKKIHAISSEGRLSGLILTAMPFVIVGAIYSSTPSFFLDVKDHPAFMPVAALVLTLIVLQAIILHRLTKFDF